MRKVSRVDVLGKVGQVQRVVGLTDEVLARGRLRDGALDEDCLSRWKRRDNRASNTYNSISVYGGEDSDVTLRDQIEQAQRPWRTCVIAGMLLLAPPFLFGVFKSLGAAEPGEYWPVLVILVLAGMILLLIGALGQWTICCPKCRGVLGFYGATGGKHCRHCGVDFEAEVDQPKPAGSVSSGQASPPAE